MAEYCIGTAQFGMKYGIANKLGIPSFNEVEKIVKYSTKKNIKYFDTAQSYGNSEEILGKALRGIKEIEKVKIISKLSPDLINGSSAEIVDSVKKSTSRLNVSSLYGFLAHRIEHLNTNSFIKALNILKKEKLIKKSGISVYTPEEALKAMENEETEILQFPLNILDKRWFNKNVFLKAEEKNIQIFFRSIFLQGLIFLNESELNRRKMSWAKPYLNKFHHLVDSLPYNPIELSYGLLKNIPGNNIIIMGLDSFSQLFENMKVLDKIEIDSKVSKEWWSKLPTFPEKFLNPALWN